MASPKAHPHQPAQLPQHQPSEGPAGSQWGQPRVGSQDGEVEGRPSTPPPLARAHHVVVDHLLQAVSKPLQTFLGEQGGKDPSLRWHSHAPSGQHLPGHRLQSHPCSQGLGTPAHPRLEVRDQLSPHRDDRVTLALLR